MRVLLQAQDLWFEVPTPPGSRGSRRARPLLEGVDLDVQGGEFTAIVGPNGAGKSTLLRLLCGEPKPTRGTILVEGQSIGSVPAWRLACRRAMMPQGSSLAFPFTAREVTRLGVDGIGRGLSNSASEAMVGVALEQADAAHLADRLYQTLSGGERQRVHFARVLAQLTAGRTVEERQILFLDEPVASLDLKHQLAVLREAKALAASGLAVVAVLHDLQLAATVADTVAVIAAGRVADRGGPGRVLTRSLLAEVFEVGIDGREVPPAPWRAVERPGDGAGGHHTARAHQLIAKGWTT